MDDPPSHASSRPGLWRLAKSGRHADARVAGASKPPAHCRHLVTGNDGNSMQSGSPAANNSCQRHRRGLGTESLRYEVHSPQLRANKGFNPVLLARLSKNSPILLAPTLPCVPDTCQPRTNGRALTQTRIPRVGSADAHAGRRRAAEVGDEGPSRGTPLLRARGVGGWKAQPTVGGRSANTVAPGLDFLPESMPNKCELLCHAFVCWARRTLNRRGRARGGSTCTKEKPCEGLEPETPGSRNKRYVRRL